MAYKKQFTRLLMIVVALSLSACAMRTVRASGDIIKESRQVSNFNSIDLSGSGEVILMQGDREALTIETDDNLMQYVEAVVRAGTLELRIKNGVDIIQPTRLVFYVEIEDLTGVSISGSGDLEANQVETDRLYATTSGSGDIQIAELIAKEVMISISGSGEISLAGKAEAQEAAISGSGKYQAGDLCSRSVVVEASGSGDATVCATETLDVTLSGSGNVDYYGHPSISISGGGSGKINSLGDK
jgi:hypothetical protein